MWARVQRSKPRCVGKGYRLESGWGFEYEAEELKLGLTDWEPLKVLGQRSNAFSGRGTGGREAWHTHLGVWPGFKRSHVAKKVGPAGSVLAGLGRPHFSSCRLGVHRVNS